MKVFIDNWAQISFIVLAIGYIIKVILEANFKRKEIRYNFFLNNRMKAIEAFLSNYANLESNYKDASTSYFYKTITAKDIDNIIVPLRYKLTDSLSLLQLYTTDSEFKSFSEVYSNFIFLMNQCSHLKHEPGMNEIEKGNELSALLDRYKHQNEGLLKIIVLRIQKDIL